MKVKLIFIFLMLFVQSCFESNNILLMLNNDKPKVIIFISPECPLCINYTKDIRELMNKFSNDINFYGIVAGNDFKSTQIDSFLYKYKLNIPIVYDPLMNYVNELNATITPQVFFLDKKNNILYEGKFDDWLDKLGRKRYVVRNYYLNDAIESYLNHKKIQITKTHPIGCYIE